MTGKFEPKQPAQLDPPKDTPISPEQLAICNGTDGNPTYVAIKGIVYDVSGNKAYGPDGSYKVFVGKDASRALALSSLKVEDVRPDWYDLSEKEKKVLNDWVTFFSKRYNIVGVVEGAMNKDAEGDQPASSSG